MYCSHKKASNPPRFQHQNDRRWGRKKAASMHHLNKIQTNIIVVSLNLCRQFDYSKIGMLRWSKLKVARAFDCCAHYTTCSLPDCNPATSMCRIFRCRTTCLRRRACFRILRIETPPVEGACGSACRHPYKCAPHQYSWQRPLSRFDAKK